MIRAVAMAALLLFASEAAAKSPLVGHYRVAEGPDVAVELVVEADGSFSYYLAAGALDEQRQGRWTQRGGKADFRGACLQQIGEGYVLHRQVGDMRLDRIR